MDRHDPHRRCDVRDRSGRRVSADRRRDVPASGRALVIAAGSAAYCVESLAHQLDRGTRRRSLVLAVSRSFPGDRVAHGGDVRSRRRLLLRCDPADARGVVRAVRARRTSRSRLGWLRPKARIADDRATPAGDPVGSKRWVLVAVVSGVAALVAIGLQPDPNAAFAKEYRAINARSQRTLDRRCRCSSASLQKQIATALRATRYPTLHPSMVDATSGNFASERIIACGQDALAPLASCTIGPRNARTRSMSPGDSTSAVYAEAFTSMVDIDAGLATGHPQRIRLSVLVGRLPGGGRRAKRMQQPQRDRGAGDQPAPAGRAGRDERVPPGDSVGATTPVSATEQVAEVDRELTQVRAAVGTVVLLAPPPGGADLQDCYRPDASPVRCVVRPSQTWLDLARCRSVRRRNSSTTRSSIHAVGSARRRVIARPSSTAFPRCTTPRTRPRHTCERSRPSCEARFIVRRCCPAKTAVAFEPASSATVGNGYSALPTSAPLRDAGVVAVAWAVFQRHRKSSPQTTRCTRCAPGARRI